MLTVVERELLSFELNWKAEGNYFNAFPAAGGRKSLIAATLHVLQIVRDALSNVEECTRIMKNLHVYCSQLFGSTVVKCIIFSTN